MSEIPRAEHPRPQFVRNNWLNLNGQWEFEIDKSNSGHERDYQNKAAFEKNITVPFCPESGLSGVGEKDFMECVWYGRNFSLPETMKDKRILLHFEAADFLTEVWINGTYLGSHQGGYTPFTFELTKYLKEENRITVRCFDDCRSRLQATGKQSDRYSSFACSYTRTTGIWQTVWLEAVPQVFITKCRYYADINTPSITIQMTLSDYARSLPLRISTSFDGRDTGSACTVMNGSSASITIPLTEKQLWEVGNGRLYDLCITLGEDRISSYFGLRDVSIDALKVRINGKSVFQRLVLDQGFYPDGIYTAPDDQDLVRDIELSLAAGFNGARLHQKVFERRFLYHADRMGYIVWGEYPSWGLDICTPGVGLTIMLPEWLEEVERDFNSPSIVGWCPLNETPEAEDKSILLNVYRATKAADTTRPVIDTSGYVHVETDIYDVHDYEQDPQKFRNRHGIGPHRESPFINFPRHERYDQDKPYFVSEYGGIWWNPEVPDGWGYGDRVNTLEEFYQRLEGLTDTLLSNPDMFGYCYTQLTDVEQEQNGIYYYDRREKFDMRRIHDIFSKSAAIEEE